MQKVLGDDVLRKAIQGEMQAMKFYSEVSKIIINKKSKNLMQDLANEEEKHKNILQKRYTILYKKEFEEIPGFVFDEKLDVKKLGLNTQSDALQILSSAIEAETHAIEFYNELLNQTESNEDIELLRSLIKFEEGHKNKLQEEYKSINKNYTWQMP
ncbi:MAG: ferritin-like domain-containing protein [Caldisericia bacterium]